jgi:hypothetical protein
MGILRASLLLEVVALSGCYSPTLRDCAVSCGSAGDCASGQLCGSDGLCAAPGVAGRCALGGPGVIDASPDGGPAAPRDVGASDAAPDGSVTLPLHVQITGKGSVIVDNYGTCSSQGAQHGDCTFAIAPGVAQTVRAVPIQLDQVFTSWTSMTCHGQSAICVFTPNAAASIVARFDHR